MTAAHIPIKAERLLLRDFQIDDWTAVHEYACDPEVVRYMQWGPNSEAQTKDFIDKSIKFSQTQPRLDFELAVIWLETSELAGAASIHVSDAVNRQGWIGYCLNKQWWGKGIGSEAATALLSFGFSQLGLHRIYATADPDNAASANVLKKVGMKKEGHFRDHKLVRGAWRDSDLYAILESDCAPT